MIPDNRVGIVDIGFASWEFLDELSQTQTKFIVRIKNNMKVNLDHDSYRVVCFCDIESGSEFCLATNVEIISDEEIGEAYRQRWQIEILWKFLKMHLKLEKLITKNVNGVITQIYVVLIAYLILKLMEIPQWYGETILDKFRYLQLELSRRCSIIHWSYDWLPKTLVP
jgi:IS4 transposase